MRTYQLSDQAEADLIRIHQYGIRKYGIAKADKYFKAFFEHFEKLAENPYSYPSVGHIRQSYRRSICGIDNVYYRINGNTVEIMSIIGRQKTETWL